MDPSHNFPPSPRDMYMYRPAQQVNGHKVQSPSPSRGRPPPTLPERKPETQLSNRTSRSSVTSRGSSSSDVASPPLSPVYVGHGQHAPQFHHQPHTHYPDNKPFAYITGINTEPTVKAHNITECNIRGRMERDSSPHSRRGSNRNDGNVSGSDLQRFTHDDDYYSDGQNEGAVYQRIDRHRIASSPDRSMAGESGYNQGGIIHTGNNLRHSEGIYGQFVEPSSGSPHRPSLTYVPPPVVPTLQPDHGKVDKGITKDQQPHYHPQQKPQHKVVNQNDSAATSMPLDTASHHHNHHHHHHCNHHHHPPHAQHVAPSHQHHHPLASTSSPLASPKLYRSSKRAKPKQERLPSPPTIPIPSPPVSLPDKYISAVTTTRTPSPPLPPPPSEIGISSKSRSSKKGIEPNPPSPLAANTSSNPQQHCLQSPNHHHHHHHHHSFSDHPPNEHPHHNHHQVKAPPIPAPPPLPPTRTSSTSQLPTNHHQDLNPTSSGVKSTSSGSPARPPGAVPHSLKHQPSLATLDDLVQVKLRAVTDPNHSNPHSPLVSPVATGDGSPGAINVRLRPTPGKFRNIYAEDATTLPPPPPLDDLDELPPPPPPPELLCDDLAHLGLDSTTHRSLPPSSHLQASEADSPLIDHIPQRHKQQATSSPQKTHSSASDTSSRCGGISGAVEGATSGLEQLILESVSNMDLDIPDDIDLSQCPGLMEINKSTPNWKRDMIEKKNQEKIEEYVKKILKEREQEAKWKNVPEWKRKILQKKEEEDGIVATPPQDAKPTPGKKPKRAPVPPPKEVKDDVTSSKSKAQFVPQSDIVPAALSIDPEELAAMPPWKRELLFKRDKVPVTFSNEFNPEDENDTVPSS